MDRKKIHIMHVVYCLDIGGLENGLINLINRMDQSKFSHSICCIEQSGRIAERLGRSDVEIYEMKKGDGSKLLLPVKLARLFRGAKIDIVHTRAWGASDGIIGARLASVPIVVHGEHGRDINDPDGSNAKRNLFRKGLSYFVDRYVTVSRELQEWLIRVLGIKEKKVQTICNGVDTDKFNPEQRHLVRAQYGFGSEKVVIGTVGRLDPVKNHQLLIKAFARLNSNYGNLTLLIIGDGPWRANLEQLTRDLDLEKSVHFLGMRGDVPDLLKVLDIFVLPSIYEGISNTILEAMATGLPVIATGVGGNPELVLDGETGYLVPMEEIGALAERLERYIHNRSIMKQHGADARKRAVRDFSLDRMVAQYEKFYTELVMNNM